MTLKLNTCKQWCLAISYLFSQLTQWNTSFRIKCIIMATWQVCGRWCRCVLAPILSITHHTTALPHIFAISLLCVTVMRVGRPEVFRDLFSSLSPPLSSPYLLSLWIYQNKGLSCICGTKYVSSPLPDGCWLPGLSFELLRWQIHLCYKLLQGVDRQREKKRDRERSTYL